MTIPSAAPSNATAGMYIDFNIPLGLYTLVQQVILNTQGNPNTPTVTVPPAQRVWFSQPRRGSDPTIEVLTVNFKLPLSVSELGWESIRVGCHIEAWYQDRSNNWRQVLDESRNPVILNLNTSQAVSWYKAHFYCYPIVAQAVQWRITRTYDPQVGTQPYVVGMRNGLIRRNIYTRSDGTQGIEPSQDAIGNTFTSYIKDWEAAKAIDNDATTYWKCAPMPDPQAVVNLYLDVRDTGGNAQLIDTLYLDPVYSGSPLNLYYSNDDTMGTLKLSPITALPTTDENTDWALGTGMWDSTPPPASEGYEFTASNYEFTMGWGPLVGQDTWIGIEWSPDFDPTSDALPSENPILFGVTPAFLVLSDAVQGITIEGTPTGGAFELNYGGQVTDNVTYNAPASLVQVALEALPAIGSGNVTVTGDNGGPYTVTFVGALAATGEAALIANAATLGSSTPTTPATITVAVVHAGGVGVNAEQTITIAYATQGVWSLSFGATATAAIAYNAAASDVETALEALASVGAGSVAVIGDPGGPWDVTFQDALGNQAIPTMTVTPSLTGGTSPSVIVSTTTPGGVPGSARGVLDAGQFWPQIYYDVGGGEIVLEFTNGTTSHSYSCAPSPLLSQYSPARILVGWTYDPLHIHMVIGNSQGSVLGTLDSVPWDGFEGTTITLDGSIGFQNFRGLLTAHVIKLENYASAQPSFLANPQIYVSPDPVYPDANGNIPATTLDNAIYGAAWVMQQNGTGGSHASVFSEKTWTPIWANYVMQQGRLFLPAQISMKYLQLEITNLTEESYPVYDSGIQVTYNLFPIQVTQTVTTPHPGLINGLLSLGADVITAGIGSVNFLNPQTVNNAINSIWGQTVNPVQVTVGAGNTVTLPNQTTVNLSGQTRSEVSSPWVYKLTPPSPTTLAANTITAADTNVVQSSQVPPVRSSLFGLQQILTDVTELGTAAVGLVAGAFTALVNTAADPATLPAIGADWWVFPGGNLRLPAAVMNGLTKLGQTILGRAPTTQTRLRFTTTSVHRYVTNTLTRDAAVAYFTGIREVQPYVTTYIDTLDPPVFTFSCYDPSQWVMTNVNALVSGPVTTAGVQYSILNPGFDTDITEWTQTSGNWIYDGSLGHWYLGTATIVANATNLSLQSTKMDVLPGANVDASVWVHWSGFAAPDNSDAIQLQAIYFLDGAYVSTQSASLSYDPWPSSSPTVGGDVWAQIVASTATDNTFTAPDGVDSMALALVVTSDATAGQVWFDTVEVGTADSQEGIIYKDFHTTSTFSKLSCLFNDSGLLRSDAMWAQADPNDANISSTALAYYVSTIPDVMPAGMWSDNYADWSDPNIAWGAARAQVAINVDPNRTFQNMRVLHFTRAAGAGAAGIKVRQLTNFAANGLFRIGCVFFKPTANTNTITLDLRRVSDGVYVYSETFSPVVGYWYNYQTGFIEIPDSEDQIYTVEITLTGSEADELYLNNLYCDVALIRYFVRLGGEEEFLHDVTPLAYSSPPAIVTTTPPVNEFSVEAVVLSPRAYAYGASFAPVYLK